MKNFMVMIALVAILAMAGTACADVSISVEKTGEVTGTTGVLDVWMVKVGGALGFFGISITDGAGNLVPVHNVGDKTGMGGANANPTPFEQDLLDYLSGADPLNTLLVDTHLMIAPGAINATPGADFYDEGNDKTNPAGIDDGYGDFFHYGMGTTSMEDSEGFTIANQLQEGSDFMQVVLPHDGIAYLVGRFDGDNTLRVTGEDVMIGVPEPGTALMLILGALCLVGIRFRK